MTFEQCFTVISLLLTIGALVGTWVGWRRRELRREDVLAWGNEGIAVLQTLLLICQDEEHAQATSKTRQLDELQLQASVLVERGRMFFRNAKPKEYGEEKEAAYRGYRPCILDHLVVGHQIARAWPTATDIDRTRIRIVAHNCLRKFVSLLQKEVGRDITASADTSRGGTGLELRQLMSDLDPTRSSEAQARSALQTRV